MEWQHDLDDGHSPSSIKLPRIQIRESAAIVNILSHLYRQWFRFKNKILAKQ